MKTLLTRTLSGAVFIGIIIGSVLFSNIAGAIVFGIVSFIGLFEFYKNLEAKGVSVQKYPGMIGGVLVYSSLALTGILSTHFYLLAIILPVFFGIFIVELYRKKENPFTNIALTITGILYAVVPLGLINWIPFIWSFEYNPMNVLCIFILVWTNDTFAYLTGMTFGKHRLFERHSPKKSWEGFIGGIIFSILMAYVLVRFSSIDIPLLCLVLAALIISIIGTLGDLVESMYKRSLDIKDSGNIMPGHGGALDRFDSILMATPFLFLLFVLFNI